MDVVVFLAKYEFEKVVQCHTGLNAILVADTVEDTKIITDLTHSPILTLDTTITTVHHFIYSHLVGLISYSSGVRSDLKSGLSPDL